MRIIIIAHDSGDYGASKSLLSTIEYLREMNNDLFVIVPRVGPFVDQLIALGVNYKKVHFYTWTYPQHPVKETLSIAFKNYIKRRLRALKCIGSYLIFIRSIKKKARFFKPEVVYTNTITHPLGIILAKTLKTPHIWHIREFIEEDHKSFFVFGKLIARKCLQLSTKNIYISHALKQKFDSKDNQNSVVIPNGVLSEEKIKNYTQFARNRKMHNPLRLLTLGRISEGKRHDIAIRVLSDLISKKGIDAKLSIVGRGSTTSLQEKVKSLNVEKYVCFTGHTDDVYAEYEKNDILIVASEMEGFGRVTAEAMATGMVVIGRNSGGTKDIINNNVNGFLFDDEKDISNIIIELMQKPQKCHKINIKANETVLKHFSLEKYLEELMKVFQNVL